VSTRLALFADGSAAESVMAGLVERIVPKAALNSPAPTRLGARRGGDLCASAAATGCRAAVTPAAVMTTNTAAAASAHYADIPAKVGRRSALPARRVPPTVRRGPWSAADMRAGMIVAHTAPRSMIIETRTSQPATPPRRRRFVIIYRRRHQEDHGRAADDPW
jgi:hypothetical protein